VYDFAEHQIVEPVEDGRAVVRLNNLNSFTHDYERAWEFGTHVIEARVPVPKVFFDGAFLHAGILRGEEEVLVIGGEYEIKLRYY
jgi:NAD+--dinitrogen-reductase ADP-D-ribosyltransferase